MSVERVVRGTSVPKTYTMNSATGAARLGPPGVGLQASVVAEMVHAVTGAVVQVALAVLEIVDSVTGAIRNKGVCEAALAANPTLPLGMYRVRFHATYPDGTDEYFPSDEPFTLIVDQQPV